LRGVDQSELIAGAGQGLAAGSAPASANVLQDGDLAALFGLEMADGETSEVSASAKPKPARRMKKAGIVGASLHTLRHTHASGLLSAHVPLPTVSARLGHANTHITATVYAHAMPVDDQQAADQWDKLMTRKLQ
jgi:integrase